MAKDAKGHGSEKRSGNTVDMTYSSRFGVGGLGKGMYARTANGQQYKLNPLATGGRIPRVGSEIDPTDHKLVTVGGGQPVESNAHAAATLASGPKSASVPVHDGATGRSDGPLAGMTQEKWNSMSQSEREGVRDNSSLTPQLKGLEGHRVEVKDTAGQGTRRFIVGKSAGWKPIHLEIARRDSSGGGSASKSYGSVHDLGKVR